ncbi:TRAP transporter small permease [Microaerobacter geothermalis]|uniref:TRAP transporter small permease n=1 Tax=Microaerobacter geothermalis TaxID=674972 RepID=UPI001F3CB0A5|nr:TRAP transporter small permease [Microaerobacter geothermalis]MCF6092982.1 TRAP transporter small permease [Microaerobacter geothermalis]
MKLFNRILNRLEEIIVIISLAIATTVTFIEVILRYGFGSSLGISQELAIFLLIFTGLIGSSIGVREKVHIGVDLVIKTFPLPLQKIMSIFGLLLSAIFTLIIAILGIMHVQNLVNFGQVTPEMEIPIYVPRMIIPIAFGLITFRFIQEAVKQIKLPPEEIFKEEEGMHQ